MSIILSSKEGVKARKKHRCCFCFEDIQTGEKYDARNGVANGDLFTMHMHPECQAYEAKMLTEEDYEDMSDPVWERKEAQAFVAEQARSRPSEKGVRRDRHPPTYHGRMYPAHPKRT